MDGSAREKVMEQHIAKTIENLKKNNMDAYFVNDRGEAVQKVSELIKERDTVAVGGSVTLFQAGIIDLLRSGRYNFLDRYAPGLSAEEIRQVFIDSFSVDVYLTSSNAVTMNGELFNVDGTSNRVAAICFGPKSVIVVVGYNKIVPDIEAAVKYVKQVAAPANAIRLSCDTYCAFTGVCQGIDSDGITDGCKTSSRICSNYLICALQREAGRIKVIIVGEALGF